MKRFLLDTNHLGETARPVSKIRDRAQQVAKQGDVFATCGPVLCELLIGLNRRKDAVRARRRLESFLKVVRLWPTDMFIAEIYAQIFEELKRAGRILSMTDMILAAMARRWDATILTTDLDFQAIPDIRTEDWITSP